MAGDGDNSRLGEGRILAKSGRQITTINAWSLYIAFAETVAKICCNFVKSAGFTK